ncbi:MAG TPA: O-antigen ligase family protein [Anaeromyxobacteraceae bacterium]
MRFVPVGLLFVSQLMFRERNFSEALSTPVDAWNVHRTVAVVLAAAIAGLYLAARGVPRRWPPALAFFACYLAVGVISLVHSSQLLYSCWKLTELLAALLVALYALRQSAADPSFAGRCYDLWLLFVRLLVATAILGALVDPSAALTPPMSDELAAGFSGRPLLPVQLYGVLFIVNANTLGVLAAVLLFTDVMSALEERRASLFRTLWLLADAVVLVLAQSRTAWAASAVAAVLAVLFSRGIRPSRRFAVASAASLAILLARGYVVAYLTRGTTVEHMSALTGRTEWWGTAIDVVNGAPLFQRLTGLGFVSANRTILATLLDHGGAATLHSDYVDALVSTGYLGMGALALAVLAFCVSVFRAAWRDRGPRAFQFGSLTAILVVRSFTGTTFAIYSDLVVAFLLVAVRVYVLGAERRALAPAAPATGAFAPKTATPVLE